MSETPEDRSERENGGDAADFKTTFYGVRVGALEQQDFRGLPIRFWLEFLGERFFLAAK
jgi:hypothetical protein